jgi:hypothetical protein
VQINGRGGGSVDVNKYNNISAGISSSCQKFKSRGSFIQLKPTFDTVNSLKVRPLAPKSHVYLNYILYWNTASVV